MPPPWQRAVADGHLRRVKLPQGPLLVGRVDEPTHGFHFFPRTGIPPRRGAWEWRFCGGELLDDRGGICNTYGEAITHGDKEYIYIR